MLTWSRPTRQSIRWESVGIHSWVTRLVATQHAREYCGSQKDSHQVCRRVQPNQATQAVHRVGRADHRRILQSGQYTSYQLINKIKFDFVNMAQKWYWLANENVLCWHKLRNFRVDVSAMLTRVKIISREHFNSQHPKAVQVRYSFTSSTYRIRICESLLTS